MPKLSKTYMLMPAYYTLSIGIGENMYMLRQQGLKIQI